MSASASAVTPSLVRGMYRRMLLLARSIRDPDRAREAQCAVRDGFRAHAAETDADAVRDLLDACDKHVSFMKIVGTGGRRPGAGVRGDGGGAAAQHGKQTFVRDPETGKWVAGGHQRGKSTTQASEHWGTVTQDHVRRATALNKRQYFMDRK